MDSTQSTYKVWLLLTMLVMGFMFALQTIGSLFAGQTAVADSVATDLKPAGAVIKITSIEELNRYLQSGNFIVGYFGSLTCGPCKAFHDTLYEMAKEYNDVLFLDISHGTFPGTESLINKYKVPSFPTFVFFDKSGTPKNSFSGINEGTKGKIAGEIVMLKEGKPRSNITFAEPKLPQQPIQQPKAQPRQKPQCKPAQQPKATKRKPTQQQARPKTQAQPMTQQPVQQQAQSMPMPQAMPQQTMMMAQNSSQTMSQQMVSQTTMPNNAQMQSMSPQSSRMQQKMNASQASQGRMSARRAFRSRAQKSAELDQDGSARSPRVRRLGRRTRFWNANAEYQ